MLTSSHARWAPALLLALTTALAHPAAAATLRNALGQLVRTKSFSGSTTELTTTGLAAGTYLLTVQLDDRIPSIRRVVVE